MKLAAQILIWKRPPITRACFDSLKRVVLPKGWTLDVFVIGSEGEESASLAREYGFYYTEYQNNPLGAKANGGLRATLQHDWDYFWSMGSDTLVSSGILSLYEEHVAAGADRIGLEDLWWWDTREPVGYYFPGYGDIRNDTIGAGRMTSRRAMESVPGGPWYDEDMRGLDGRMHKHLSRAGFDAEVKINQHDGPECLLELRSDEQLTQLTEKTRTKWDVVTLPPHVQSVVNRTQWPVPA